MAKKRPIKKKSSKKKAATKKTVEKKSVKKPSKQAMRKKSVKKAATKKKIAKKTTQDKPTKQFRPTKKKPIKRRWVDQPVAKTPLPEKGQVRVYEVSHALDQFLVLEAVPAAPETKMRYQGEVMTFGGLYPYERKPLQFMGQPMPKNWKPVPLRLMEKRKRPEPDIWKVWTEACLVLTDKALKPFKREFEQLGQLLPLTYAGQKLKAFNLLHVVDGVDPKQCHWREKDNGMHAFLAMGPEEKIGFKPKKVKDLFVFTIPQRNDHYYCVERTGDPDTEFKARYEASGLTGLKFRLVWEGKG